MDEAFIVFKPYDVMIDDFSAIPYIDTHILEEANVLIYFIATAYNRTPEELISNLRRLADIYESHLLPPGFMSQRLGKYYLSEWEKKGENNGI